MKLKYLRALKGVTQREVSATVGCSEVVYNRYENGEREPSLDMVIKLADYFDVTTDFLLGHVADVPELLDDFEISLIQASRRADQRAREDALSMLVAHAREEDKKEKLA